LGALLIGVMYVSSSSLLKSSPYVNMRNLGSRLRKSCSPSWENVYIYMIPQLNSFISLLVIFRLWGTSCLQSYSYFDVRL